MKEKTNRGRILGKMAGLWLLLFGAFLMLSPLTAKAQTVAKIKVTAKEEDQNPIPDKYNTGCSGTLTIVRGGMNLSGITVLEGESNLVFNFSTSNQNAEGTYYIDNYDFSARPLSVSNEAQITKSITLVFRNCKFSKVQRDPYDSNLRMQFKNCSIQQYIGSNASFTRCAIGGTCEDGMEIQRNVTVKYCYFSDFNKKNTTGTHTDGIHIFGNSTKPVTVNNILVDHCRFEIPAIVVKGDVGYINACIMFSMEFGNAKNVKFTNNILNGGGYTAYACVKPGCESKCKLSNIVLDNNRVGDARAYLGVVHEPISDGVSITELSGTDSLYVGSVWKDATGIHLSVTNDTKNNRILRIVTDKGIFNKSMPACPSGEAELSKIEYFSSMPFDRVITVPKNCGYVLCLDATDPNRVKQIRFVNYTGKDVSVSPKVFGGKEAVNSTVLMAGKCGDNVNFSLSKDFVLTLSGSGATYKYWPESATPKYAPWYQYAGMIKKIVISNNITEIGDGIFHNCLRVSEVSIPNSVTVIHQMAFKGCVCLKNITLPKNAVLDGVGIFDETQVPH